MEKQVMMTTDRTGWDDFLKTVKKAAGLPSAVIEMLRGYYSAVLEREVTTPQTYALLEVQAAFIAGVMPAGYPLALRAAFCAWFLLSLRRCRRKMNGKG